VAVAAPSKTVVARKPAPKRTAATPPEPVAAAAPVAAAPGPPEPANTTQAAPAVAAPDFARIARARQVGDVLLGYFRKPRLGPPPIWNSPAIMSSASGMREELHARGQARLDAPRWRIGATSATMTTAYRGKGNEAATAGVLTVDMVWRENRWLVTGLSVENSR
jgi:hypothetical protein